jgi:GAF domain-containing protein
VDRRDDERAHLYRIVQTIGSGPDLETILRGVVHLATEATGCHACLIWFAERDRLTLRASSPPYEHLAGDVDVKIGEGLVGWVAKTRRSAFIREKALADPRVKYFPEFEEERFQSLVSVPMFGRDGEVMGVISLHAEAPHEFAQSDLDFLEHTASLIAGAVENARLFEQTSAQVALLRDVSQLSQRIASAGSVDDVLTAVTAGVGSLLGVTRAEMYLTEPDGRLHLRASRPPRADAPPMNPTSLIWEPIGEGIPAIVPLVVGDERLGVLAVQLPESSPEADTVLAAVGAHTAVAIRQHQVIASLREENLAKDLFQALADGGRTPAVSDLAERLGFDLDAPHLVLHVVEAVGAPALERGRAGPRRR